MSTRRELKGPPPTPMRTLRGLDYELERVQSAVERSTRKARSDQHARGADVRIVSTATGNRTVAHKLGRKPRHFDVVRIAGAVAYTIGPANSRTFTVGLSGAGTIDFWVW